MSAGMGKMVNSALLWAAKCKEIYAVFFIYLAFFRFFIINEYYFYNKNKSRTTDHRFCSSICSFAVVESL